MPRKKLIRSDQFPYHVTSRSNNKEWFYIPIECVWSYCNTLLNEGKIKFNVQIDAFVLMRNHYHLCIRTPESNIDLFMRYFNKNLAQNIARHAKRINRIFGGPYKWSLITKEAYYLNVIRYIYQNPLRANIVDFCEQYPYSDLKEQKFSPEMFNWINKTISKREVSLTSKNLKKYQI